jgi:hypothetical protein
MKTTVPPFLLVLLSFCFFLASCKEKTLFRLLPSSKTGIHFNNQIVENDTINPIDVTNIYNGGGVGIGDFNNDGLQDVYFSGNLVPNQLYLNQGKLKVHDVTKEAGVEGKGRWCRGVSVVDINNDGWEDIYVSASMLDESTETAKPAVHQRWRCKRWRTPLYRNGRRIWIERHHTYYHGRIFRLR